MSAKEDLQKKIQSLKDQLNSAGDSLNQILIAEYPLQPGAVVVRRGERFTVSSVQIKWGRATAWGKKTLKSGKLGNQEFELYGNLTPAPPETT